MPTLHHYPLLAGSRFVRLILAEYGEEAILSEMVPWERTPERVTYRNGTRPKVLSTKAGDLTLAIPKLRKGSFFPELLEPRRRIDQALYAVVMEAYVVGDHRKSRFRISESRGLGVMVFLGG